jgi:predicted regulator of Ras-like GTPase activity (Roadblock/LC7/MglB family)
VNVAAAPAPAVRRSISTHSVSKKPAPAERMVTIELGDVVNQLPHGMANSASIDLTRRISLRAAEIEKGMAKGRPSVSLGSLYEQAPEIFDRPPTATGDVPLPFAKMLEQFSAFQVRPDQQQERVVPQVETPFLKVTLEDSERFGTPAPTSHIEASAMPPVKLEPATAKTIAAAEPEPAAKERPEAAAPPPIATDGAASRGASRIKPADISAPPVPARIPFRLTPNGTDAPASECVPASSGPSVPNSAAAPPAEATPPPPTRIPFKIPAPSEAVRPKPEPAAAPKPQPIKLTAPAEKKGTSGDKGLFVSLPLRKVLENLPAFQLAGDPDDVPKEARIELPFSIIEPQLVLGRVGISPKEFEEALPEEYAHVFDPNEGNTPVSLPLDEVLQNLPTTSLRMRDDQEEIEAVEMFETPFSRTAEEDAKRMNVAAAPIAKPVAPAEPELKTEVEAPAPKRERTPLQAALDTDEDLDAKAIAAHASRLAGVRACAVMFADGLSLAGDLPAELGSDGLCAMAPSLVQKLQAQISETKLGGLQSVTLYCGNAPVSLFNERNICLAVVHSGGDIATDVRERLAFTARELADMYPPPL